MQNTKMAQEKYILAFQKKDKHIGRGGGPQKRDAGAGEHRAGRDHKQSDVTGADMMHQ